MTKPHEWENLASNFTFEAAKKGYQMALQTFLHTAQLVTDILPNLIDILPPTTPQFLETPSRKVHYQLPTLAIPFRHHTYIGIEMNVPLEEDSENTFTHYQFHTLPSKTVEDQFMFYKTPHNFTLNSASIDMQKNSNLLINEKDYDCVTTLLQPPNVWDSDTCNYEISELPTATILINTDYYMIIRILGPIEISLNCINTKLALYQLHSDINIILLSNGCNLRPVSSKNIFDIPTQEIQDYIIPQAIMLLLSYDLYTGHTNLTWTTIILGTILAAILAVILFVIIAVFLTYRRLRNSFIMQYLTNRTPTPSNKSTLKSSSYRKNLQDDKEYEDIFCKCRCTECITKNHTATFCQCKYVHYDIPKNSKPKHEYSPETSNIARIHRSPTVLYMEHEENGEQRKKDVSTIEIDLDNRQASFY